jgi:nucleoside-diphosphate-sugar epimerase
VAGTNSILVGALKYANDTVKRIVVTSSCASVLTPDTKPRIFSEVDWNEHSIKEVETKGRDAAKPEMYRASKTLAERAAWKFMEINKSKANFDLVVLNPPFVYGPVLHEVDKPDDLNTSMLDWFNTVIKGTRSEEQLVSIGCGYL